MVIWLNCYIVIQPYNHINKSMLKQEIISQLIETHQLFIQYIQTLEDKEFMSSYNNKWTAGQQVDHIYRGVKPLTQVFLMPNFVTQFIFGKANRPSRTYDKLVERYHEKLAEGVVVTGRYAPKEIALEQRENLLEKVTKAVQTLTSQVETLTEEELDKLLIPHPLLGKLTVREMMYFTIYHVGHHHQMTIKNLGLAMK